MYAIKILKSKKQLIFIGNTNKRMINNFYISNHIQVAVLNLKQFANERQLITKRDIETKGKLFLLEKLLTKEVQLEYSSNGKPNLVDQAKHISISHSHDKLAVIINIKEETGVDIEIIRDKILNIKHKFLSDDELLDAKDDVEKLIIYWSAKETLYKIYGLPAVDFINHLHIQPFEKELKGTIMGSIKLPTLNADFKLHYEKIEEYVLVYALEKILC